MRVCSHVRARLGRAHKILKKWKKCELVLSSKSMQRHANIQANDQFAGMNMLLSWLWVQIWLGSTLKRNYPSSKVVDIESDLLRAIRIRKNSRIEIFAHDLMPALICENLLWNNSHEGKTFEFCWRLSKLRFGHANRKDSRLRTKTIFRKSWTTEQHHEW